MTGLVIFAAALVAFWAIAVLWTPRRGERPVALELLTEIEPRGDAQAETAVRERLYGGPQRAAAGAPLRIERRRPEPQAAVEPAPAPEAPRALESPAPDAGAGLDR